MLIRSHLSVCSDDLECLWEAGREGSKFQADLLNTAHTVWPTRGGLYFQWINHDPTARGLSSTALPEFGDSRLLMHTPFDAELPTLIDVLTLCGEMLVSWDHHASRTKRAKFHAGSPILGVLLYFMPTPLTQYDRIRQHRWGGAC